MSLLDQASLIVTPNAYKAGKLYSVIPNTTLGDMDVSRALSATRVNEQKFIEIARTNLALRSEEFDNLGVWPPSIGGTGVNPIRTANSTISPIGTLTADTILFDRGAGNTATDQSVINQLITITAAETYVFSCYLKATTISDVGKQVFIRCGGTGGLIAVTLLSTWVRFQTSATISAGSNQFQIGNRGAFTSSNTVSADIWGAQLEIGTLATKYIPTTTVAKTKFADITQDGLYGANIPRIDYPPLGGCPSILVEPVRTNLVLYSADFDNVSWIKSGAGTGTVPAVTSNANISPSGLMDADKIDLACPTTGSSNWSWVYQSFNATSGLSYTFTVYLKAATPSDVGKIIRFGYTSYNNITLTADWKRYTNTAVAPSTASYSSGFRLRGTETTDTTASFFAYGAQLEAGAYATSYIPTTTVAVLRNDDVISKTGISTLIGQAEGTIFWDVKDLTGSTSTGNPEFMIRNTAFTNWIGLTSSTFALPFRITVKLTSVVIPIIDYTSAITSAKACVKYGTFGATLFVNGVPVATSAVNPNFSFDNILFRGSIFSYKTNSFALWKTALTDDQCILLTGASFSTYPEMANALIYTIQ
jgi:hypothetical protein